MAFWEVMHSCSNSTPKPMEKLPQLLACLGLCCVPFLCRGATNIPFGKAPPLNATPTNAVIRYASVPPPSPFTPACPTSPGTQTNFLAIADDGTLPFWPDTAGAVGPEHGVNTVLKWGKRPISSASGLSEFAGMKKNGG